ncbi:membrane protein BRI3 isoform 2-T2 [Callospermophilus lateralis]|uniref:Membrane protein BRI3 n=3 Tax=Marmotini TaxID=337730 RepID=I3N7Z7_ICTTR|nr:brain protein I3 [Ictidomys tridecemlineatus]
MSVTAHLLLGHKGAFASLTSGSLPLLLGVSLRLAMASTVQAAGIPTHHPRVYNIQSRTVTRYPANSIVVVGGCPVCRVGVLEDCFTFLGIFLAIILFPFGFICCFALKKRRCPNCGATFT